MKQILLVFLFSLPAGLTFAQPRNQIAPPQVERLKNADNELNRVYKQILLEYRSDTLFVQNLKKAQRIWIQFRDAEVSMRYPLRKTDPIGDQSSVCIPDYIAQLTKQRVETLKLWLDGWQADDVCRGSIKPKGK